MGQVERLLRFLEIALRRSLQRGGNMRVSATGIAGCFMVESDRIEDPRGWFKESWRAGLLQEATGIPFTVAQNNHSRSHAGVLRGFHAEPWHKLFYVARGTAFVAVADIRPDSKTYGSALTMTIGDAPGTHVRIFVQRGLANAFYCFNEVDYINEVSEVFSPEGRRGIRWDDPTLAIDWPDRDPILSEQDRTLPHLPFVRDDRQDG
jgi:dTDP-4-dehydrorhamnose 3,5-epimerase